MKAVVFHGVGDIRLDDVPEPKLKERNDAIVRITASAICGTDLHLVRGTMPGMVPGTILGHEGVGIVEEVGKHVRNIRPGDRVVIPSTIGCGYCAYCREGYFSQCDVANPNGMLAGTAFFGGPRNSGPFQGLQAEFARIPFANVGLVKLPEEVSDEQAILLSDIFPTGYFGADNAEIKPGNTVAVFGCGPVGLFAILSAFMLDAGRVIAIDRIPSRLDMARTLGAEVVNFEEEDPVKTILDITGGIGVDRVIDAVGVDAVHAESGPAAKEAKAQQEKFERETREVAPKTRPQGDLWRPGGAPSQVLDWAVGCCAKAGTLSVIGVYPESVQFFPFGMALNRNLVIKGGNCNHRAYIPRLLDLVQSGAVRPEQILTQIEPITSAIDAYEHFDTRQAGWIKTELLPGMASAGKPTGERRTTTPRSGKIPKETRTMAAPISKSIIVNKPVNEVYNLWANFENFPHFMDNIKSVTRTGDRVSHWVMNGPLGKDIEWDAVVVDMQENRRIAWNNTDQSKESDIRTTGEVTFRSLAPTETEVHATVLYEPKSGIGQTIAKLFTDPEDRLEEDLRNFKLFAEEGTMGGDMGHTPKGSTSPRR